MGDRARRGREVLRGVLGVDAALDRVAVQADVLLREGQLLAGGDEDLLAHDVDARRLLGHAVLDLDAGVHLEEEVLAVLQQALDRARAVVADGLGRVRGDLADLLAQLLVDQRGGGLLDQLLVAALDRAVALAEVDDGAVLVGEHLDLDVARVGQVALEVDGVVGEELLALARGALEGVLELGLLQRDAEALAAAAARGLDGDRVADLLGDLLGLLERLDRVGGARDDRHAGVLHQLAGAGLGAHRLDRARGRADERDAGLLQALGERGVLGQEAVAGVDGLGAGGLDDLHDLVHVEVGLGRRPGPEQVRLAGPLDVLGVAVGLGVDGDGGDAELVERSDHADGDLATVGDQDLGEHGREDIRRGPASADPRGSRGATSCRPAPCRRSGPRWRRAPAGARPSPPS